MPRVAPITGKADVPAEHHAVVDDVLSVFGQIRGPFSMLLHSRRWPSGCCNSSVQPRRHRRRGAALVARDPRLGARARRQLCLGRPGRRGAACRVPEATIDMLRAKGDPPRSPRRARHRHLYPPAGAQQPVDQAVFDRLQKKHGTQWLVELTAAAGYFGMLSGIVNAFDVAAPPDGDKLPA